MSPQNKWDLVRESSIPEKFRETDWNHSGNYMYCLLLNTAMAMPCMFLITSSVYVPNSINPTVLNCNILLRQSLEEKAAGRSEKPWPWNGLNCHTIHAVSCRPLITQTWVWYQVSPYNICGGQSATGTDSSTVLLFSHHYLSTNTLPSSSHYYYQENNWLRTGNLLK